LIIVESSSSPPSNQLSRSALYIDVLWMLFIHNKHMPVKLHSVPRITTRTQTEGCTVCPDIFANRSRLARSQRLSVALPASSRVPSGDTAIHPRACLPAFHFACTVPDAVLSSQICASLPLLYRTPPPAEENASDVTPLLMVHSKGLKGQWEHLQRSVLDAYRGQAFVAEFRL